MRRKGKIWQSKYQELIVRSYQAGMFVSEISSIPEIAALGPSEFTIRNILKANNIRPTWRKKKRKPEMWRSEVQKSVVRLRNQGCSIRTIRDRLNGKHPEIKLSKSSVVCLLEENAEHITYLPRDKKDIWKPELAGKIAEMYKSGMLIKEIRDSELLRDYSPSGYMIRDILKSQGVKLTWKKGELRRWPDDLQVRVVELYQDGMTFEEIKSQPEIRENRPTDYAIRKILKRHGIKTREATSIKTPVSEARFRRYRDGQLSSREVSAIHKHLALYPPSMQKMLERMGLTQMDTPHAKSTDRKKVEILGRNAMNWSNFFSWTVKNLEDDDLKRHVFDLGLEFGRGITFLKTAWKQGNEDKITRAWSRLDECSRQMTALFEKILWKPAISCQVSRIRG